MPLQINKINKEELSGTRTGVLMQQINMLNNMRAVITEIAWDTNGKAPKRWGTDGVVPPDITNAVRNVKSAHNELAVILEGLSINPERSLSTRMSLLLENIVYRSKLDRSDLSRVIEKEHVKYIELCESHIKKLRDNLSKIHPSDPEIRLPSHSIAVELEDTGDSTTSHTTDHFRKNVAGDYSVDFNILSGIFGELYDMVSNTISKERHETRDGKKYVAQYCIVNGGINPAYSQFYIPKNGYKSLRLITAPNVELKYTQRNINRSIQDTHHFSENTMAYKTGADHVKQLKELDLKYDSMIAVDFSNYFSEIKGYALKTAMGELLLPTENSRLNAALKFFMSTSSTNTPDKADLISNIDPVIAVVNDAISTLCKEIDLNCRSYEPILRRKLPNVIRLTSTDIDDIYTTVRSMRQYPTDVIVGGALISNLMQVDRIATEDWLIDNMHSIVVIHQTGLLKVLIVYKALLSELKKAGIHAADLHLCHSIARLIVTCRYYTVTGNIFMHAPELRTHSGIKTQAAPTIARHIGNGIQVINNAVKRTTGFDIGHLTFRDEASTALFLKFAGLQLDALMSVLTHVVSVPEYHDRYLKDTIVSTADLSEMFKKEVVQDGTIASTSKALGLCPQYKVALRISNNYGVNIRLQKALPQGAPTSGTIANLLNEVLLHDISKCIDYPAKVAIYSDNLFAFFNKGATQSGRPAKYAIMDAIRNTCRRYGVKINSGKTGIYENCDRKLLGVINSVDGDIRLSRRKMHELNQIIINLNKRPVINYKGKTYTRYAMSSYLGKLNWFNRVNDGTHYSRKKLIRPSW